MRRLDRRIEGELRRIDLRVKRAARGFSGGEGPAPPQLARGGFFFDGAFLFNDFLDGAMMGRRWIVDCQLTLTNYGTYDGFTCYNTFKT